MLWKFSIAILFCLYTSTVTQNQGFQEYKVVHQQYVNIKRYPYRSNTNIVSNAHQQQIRPQTQAVAGRSTFTHPNNLNESIEKFNSKLFQVIGTANTHKNVIYSPISLHLLLAFIFAFARGQTADELQRVLALPHDPLKLAELFLPILKSQHDTPNAQLVMANKMFYNTNLVALQNAAIFGRDYFQTELDAAQFTVPHLAAAKINAWVAKATHNRIYDIISPDVLDARTQAILVNAIYFKAKWAQEFSTSDTLKQPFYINEKQEVPVEMMYNEESYNYAELPELGARAVELPYLDSNLSMLIILPNEKHGLQALEQRFSDVPLSYVADKLKLTNSITLRLPKFQIEFEQDMMEPLAMLGVRTLFTPNAELENFFQSNQPVGISKVQHKAFIEVNEAGSEAAAASFAKIVPLSLTAGQILFTVDHPFMFAIRSPQAIFFVGHVVRF